MRADAFLQWALPRLRLRWIGFRRMRAQVVKRIDRRVAELGLADLAAYRARLEQDPAEWRVLDHLCRVTVSRFARDRAIWDELVATGLPRIDGRAWSAGCGAGEEPYTLAIAWEMTRGDAPLAILATDVDDHQLARAAVAKFPSGTLRELPIEWQRAAFDGDQLRERFRARVRFARHDVRTPPPPGPFDLVLCRNLAFSYFDEALQREVARAIRGVLSTNGVLVVGLDEQLPDDVEGFQRCSPCIYAAF